MKKLLIIAAVTLASGGAFASKARLQALGSSAHLVDVQTMFNNPSDITLMGDMATFEMGTNGPFTYTPPSGNAANLTNHEGGLIRAHGDARWGFYLGHKSPTVALSRSNAWTGGGTILNEENPIEVFYAQKADLSWGASWFYSNSDKKATKLKQDTMGVRVGARSGAWDASLNVGLSNNAKDESNAASIKEIKGSSAMKLAGGYTMDTLYFYGNYGMSGFKATAASTDTADVSGSQLTLGVVDTIKGEGRDFFYGVSYHMDSYKQKVGTEQKSEATYLPVVIGVEGEATSWMTLRASVTQNVILGTIKDEIGLVTGAALAETNTWNDSTTVAAGAGLKFNKFTLDGTLGAANGGVVNTTNLLANASLTYLF
ncbi:MAG TPA: hypothetical protein VIG33_04450 [Pseudobdellovibrionaceae bacterium]|jgi:hypothetical protein